MQTKTDQYTAYYGSKNQTFTAPNDIHAKEVAGRIFAHQDVSGELWGRGPRLVGGYSRLRGWK
jgi:hypothetical protein